MSVVVFKIREPEHFNKLMMVSDEKFVIIDYSAEWCGPCKKIAPFYESMSKKYPDVAFAKMNTDALPLITEGEKVSSLPTFILYREGKEINRIEGASTSKLTTMLESTKTSIAKF